MQMLKILIPILLIIVFYLGFWAYKRYRINYYAWYVNFLKPKYQLIYETMMVAMKDGTRLATDIYRPKAKRKFPIVLVRTPYNKSGSLHPYRQIAELFASQGFVCVVQDVRGKYGSEGKFYPYAYEGLDGHDTVTWAGEAPWSNGKVAMFGISYLGSCAWLAARHKSPYLRTIITLFTTSDTHSEWIDQGIPFLKGPLFWLGKYGGKRTNNKLTNEVITPVLWNLPVNNLDMLMMGRKIPFFKDYLEHPKPDSFWEEISGRYDLDIPVFILGGWFDPFLRGTFEDFQNMASTSQSSHNKLVIGPWGHNPSHKFKAVDFGKKADFNSIVISTLEWFNVWLKGMPAQMTSKNVKYFMMGKNEWREADGWPPVNVTDQKYFLSWEKDQGTLALSPSQNAMQNQYIYNPIDPVLFRGAYILEEEAWLEQTEQSEVANRDDVLVFTSEPMERDLSIAGNVKLILHVSSQAVDTDFCAKICDVHPNGEAYNLTPGFIRMRYRESLDSPTMMEPGTIYRIEIVFKPIANTFLRKHRIQLQITSSDFPVHDRNLNTGLSCEFSIEIKEAIQTVHCGGAFDSHLLLPVLNEESSS